MKFHHVQPRPGAVVLLAAALQMAAPGAGAATLHAPSGGTFTMNLDRDALVPYFGYRLTSFFDAAASDYTHLANTGDAFLNRLGIAEISAVNRVFEVTPIGPDPTGQAVDRHVQGTSADFVIDSETLAGVAGAEVGLTGVQGFYAPLWARADGGFGGGLVNGDFSVAFDPDRQTGGRSGWYLANNIYFTMAVYDFGNVGLAFTDAGNWRLSGDLLMSPENGGMLKGATLNDVGDFCLGTGIYAGCGQISAVPVPAGVWLFGSGLMGAAAGAIRKKPLAS